MEKLAIKQDKICFRFQNSRAKGRTDPRSTFFDVTTGRPQVLDIAFGSRGWIAGMLFIISGPVSGPVSMCAPLYQPEAPLREAVSCYIIHLCCE